METTPETFANRARTKIVATLGPASRSPEMISSLIGAGVDVFRVNMAHGSRQDHEELIDTIEALSQEHGSPVGILIDLAGPKIRLGHLFADPTPCAEGEEFLFVRGDKAPAPNALVSNYARLVDELDVGDKVMLADGTVAMVIVDKLPDAARARVINAGTIRHRQGINLPGVKLTIPALSERDRENAAWAARRGVDFVGLSFVRQAEDVRQLRALLDDHGGQRARIIAKIEKPEALDNLEAIMAEAGGAMVARGDLGVEIDVAEIAVAQKRIIATCARLGKPVIVATQMLESMVNSRRPTRAEVSDVANALLDGADACMLSGETAMGAHPVEAVGMMNRIMKATEPLLRADPARVPTPTGGVDPITAAVVNGAGHIAQELNAALVVISTASGATALVRSKMRDFVPTIGTSEDPRTLRQMCLFWGVTPLMGAPAGKPVELRRFVDQWGREEGALVDGDRVVFVTGTGIVEGAHNALVVHEVGAK